MKLKSYCLVFFAFLLLSCQAQNKEAYENVTAATFADKIKVTPNPQIIDVRTPQEYEGQHLDNAQNIDWNGSNFEQRAAKLDKNKPVFVYCMMGGRSKKASDKLIEMGFAKVYDLQGGIMKWNAAGFSKPSQKIIGVSSQEYQKLVGSQPKVLVNFFAEWCGPCKKMKPYLTSMQAEYKDVIKIVRLDADQNKTLVSDMKIAELPVLILYQDGEIKWRHTGYISKEDLEKQLQ